ncbi:MAG TPA: hypothetical protein VIN72_08120 [Lutibacter sp.]
MMKRALQILTHKGMINGEFTCHRQAERQAASVPIKNKIINR